VPVAPNLLVSGIQPKRNSKWQRINFSTTRSKATAGTDNQGNAHENSEWRDDSVFPWVYPSVSAVS
jgi:hypothetical protein